MFYGVVEFKSWSNSTANKELSVVPITWLIKNDRKCYWPTRTKNISLAEFIRSCPLPQKSWPRYDVFKVHLKTASYELADKELERIISDYEEKANFSNQSVGRKSVSSESSDADTEDEGPLKKQMKRSDEEGTLNIPTPSVLQLQPVNENNLVLYTPSASSTTTITMSGIPEEAFNNDILIDNGTENFSLVERTPAGNSNYVNSQGSMGFSTVGISDNKYNTASFPGLDETCTGISNNDGGASHNKSYYSTDFQCTVLTSLANIQTTNEEILVTMQEILRYNKKIAIEKLIAPENLPEFPLKTYENFLSFEKLGKEDPSVNQYMVRRLAALGGSGVEGVTRRIMKFLLSNELGNQFNWKGRHHKVAFEGTATMAIVYEAAKLNFPTNEKNDMRVSWSVKE